MSFDAGDRRPRVSLNSMEVATDGKSQTRRMSSQDKALQTSMDLTVTGEELLLGETLISKLQISEPDDPPDNSPLANLIIDDESDEPAFSGLPPAVVVVNSRGRIVAFDANACAMFQRQPLEAVGSSLLILIPPPTDLMHGEYLSEHFQSLFQSNAAVQVDLSTNPCKNCHQGIRKDGTVFAINGVLQAVPGPEFLVFMTIQEISDDTPDREDTITVPDPEAVALGESRFEKDFETLETLGSGSFGVVLRCRNKLDNIEYAIKQVVLSEPKEEKEEEIPMQGRERIGSMIVDSHTALKLKEIGMMAQLGFHPNIIHYHQSWTERCFLSKIHMTKQQQDQANKDNGMPGREELAAIWSDSDAGMFNTECDVEEDVGDPNSIVRVMYIQMQLVQGYTLKEWLENPSRKIDMLQNYHIFVQILQGLSFIHYSGMMHRDIKPENIMIEKEKSRNRSSFPYERFLIKIADFGLATLDLKKTKKGHLNDKTLESVAGEGQAGPGSPTNDAQKNLMTTGVGTRLYGAPEQLDTARGKQVYDYGVDIYAAGCILAEMFMKPIVTTWERVSEINKLRDGQISPELMQKYPREAKWIHLMLSKNPRARPCADELLTSIGKADDLQELLSVPLPGWHTPPSFLSRKTKPEKKPAISRPNSENNFLPVQRLRNNSSARISGNIGVVRPMRERSSTRHDALLRKMKTPGHKKKKSINKYEYSTLMSPKSMSTLQMLDVDEEGNDEVLRLKDELAIKDSQINDLRKQLERSPSMVRATSDPL